MLQVPSVLNRLVPLPDEGDGQRRFVLLEDVIGPRLDALFGGFRVAARVAFRVTRNSDLTIQETEVKSSLLSTIQETLRQRKWGAAVRLEIADRADDGFLAQLQTASALDLDDRDVYKVPGPVDLTALAGLCKLEGFRDLKEPPFEPQMPAPLANRASIFAAIREQDILVHHPYESFGPVVQFIEQAAEDPHVLAIKQTLYRTADDNPIITRPGPRRRERQAGDRPGRAPGPARRGEQHRQGPDAGEGRRPRRLRHRRPQDPLQGRAGRPPRGRRHPPLRPPRHRQLQPDHRAALHRPRASSPAAPSSARTPAPCSTS